MLADRLFLLCLLIALLSVNLTQCRGRSSFRSRSSGSSRSSSRGSYSRPKLSSSGLFRSGGIFGSHSYPLGKGLSGVPAGTGYKPSFSGSHVYPLGTGFSGLPAGTGYKHSSSGSHSYPLGTGLSGVPAGTGYKTSSSGSHNYPLGTGLSGSGYNKNTGISGGSSGSHIYPSAPTGGSGTNKPSSSGNSNNYKPAYETHYRPTHTHNTYTAWNPPTYYASPHYVYVNEYRHSGSRYSDILTGLALYNMGRSHSHYRVHHYYDDYHRRRNQSGYSSESRRQNEATCTLKITENGKLQVLQIPCEIVSTFTEGSTKVTPPVTNQVNTTVCVTNTTVINNNLPQNGSSDKTVVSANGTLVNVTTCTTNSTKNSTIDPLSVKGAPVNADANMNCVVEIKTRDAFLRNNVDCKMLMAYAKTPEPPKQESAILPDRNKLKSWIAKPPWWMAIFIAV